MARLVTIVLVTAWLRTAAAESNTPERTAHNVIYVQVDGMAAIVANGGAASLNYERQVAEHVAIHAGLGYASYSSFFFASGTGAQAVSAELEAKFLVGNANHAFEIGGGVAFLRVFRRRDWCGEPYDGNIDSCDSPNRNAYAAPVVSAAYRYQPAAGGVFVRTGLGWHYGYGLGMSLGLGYTF